MNEFIHDDFLLKTAPARRRYHEFAARLPIIDYHNHLDPRELADDRQFENLTHLWIAGDPYKHRAMRIASVPERFITGDATDREKFDAWAATAPLIRGNPLFHWTALELKRYFDMTTDSRSLLSMSRHEYFRRVLCDWLGDQVQAGALPADDQLLGPLVRAVSYENAHRCLSPEMLNPG